MNTILVVDDMAICREPLEMALQSIGYQTLSAADGREALDLVRAKHPDLILLDVTMPVMDGLKCLKALRVDPQSRRIPVIMLTDASDRGVVVEAAKIGMQGYLLKSQFSLDEMLSRVQEQLGAAKRKTVGLEEQACQLGPPKRESAPASEPRTTPPLSRSRVDVLKEVDRKLQLKAMPPVLHHVMALTNSNKTSLDDIARAIRKDQSLTLKIMKVANSSFYASGKPVQDPMEAAQRIGLSEVQNIIVAILAIEHFDTSSLGGLIPQRFWEHSLATATLANLIGQEIEVEDGDQLFLAGLLHDFGRMILGTVFPDDYKWVLESGAKRRADLLIPEREVFDLTHVEVTKRILTEWKLSDRIVDAAYLHHLDVEQIKQTAHSPKDALVIALANRLAPALALGDSGNSMLRPISDFVQALGLKSEAVRSITQKAVEKTRDMTLLYSARSDQELLQPLAEELAQQAEGQARLAVFAGKAHCHPLSLLYEQLGWLDSVQPRLAILCVSAEWDLARRFDELQKVEESVSVKLAVLVVSPSGTVAPSPHLVQNRPCGTLQFPVRYSEVIEAIVKLRNNLAPEPIESRYQ